MLSLFLISCKQNKGEIKEDLTVANKNKIHDTILIHDTIKFYSFKDNFKRIKLFCVEENEGIQNGKIYTAIDKIIISDDNNKCYYIDGVGLKKVSRFLKTN